MARAERPPESPSEPRPWWEEVSHLREDTPAGSRRRGGGTRPAVAAPAARRTVRIRGQVQPAAPRRLVEVQRRRPPRGPAERVGARPDRIALWAVFIGLMLIAVAALTAHGL